MTKLQGDLQALNKSIKHWERLSKAKSLEEVDVKIGVGPSECALCTLYFSRCLGCPIEGDTGKIFCHDTPYDRIEEYLDTVSTEGFDLSRWEPLAKAELEYLKTLRAKLLENK